MIFAGNIGPFRQDSKLQFFAQELVRIFAFRYDFEKRFQVQFTVFLRSQLQSSAEDIYVCVINHVLVAMVGDTILHVVHTDLVDGDVPAYHV